VQGVRPDAATWAAVAAVILGVAVVARYDPAARATAVGLRLRFSPALLYAFAAGIAFATSFILGQQATVLYGEVQTVFIGRFFGLAAIVAVLLAGRTPPRLPARWWPGFAGMGALDALALVSVVAAGHAPGAEIATVVSSTFGAVTVILARVFLRESIAALQWAGIAMIVVGVAVLTARI
jgi:drug/metabolite transporter (DMT)-like permease